MGDRDLPNAFIIEVNGRFIVPYNRYDPNPENAYPVRLGEFKDAAVFNLAGGRLVSRDWGRDWSMGVIESDTGDTTPTPLSWVDDSRSMPEFEYTRENSQDVLRCGPDKMVVALPAGEPEWMHVQLPEAPVRAAMKTNWQKA